MGRDGKGDAPVASPLGSTAAARGKAPRVVVNDLGGSGAGEGRRPDARAAGRRRDHGRGRRGPCEHDDCASWNGAECRSSRPSTPSVPRRAHLQRRHPARQDELQMSEEEFDSVIRVHLKGHFAPIRLRRLLAGEGQGDGRADQRRGRHHRLGVGPLRQRRAGQITRGKAGIASMTIVLARELVARACG